MSSARIVDLRRSCLTFEEPLVPQAAHSTGQNNRLNAACLVRGDRRWNRRCDYTEHVLLPSGHFWGSTFPLSRLIPVTAASSHLFGPASKGLWRLRDRLCAATLEIASLHSNTCTTTPHLGERIDWGNLNDPHAKAMASPYIEARYIRQIRACVISLRLRACRVVSNSEPTYFSPATSRNEAPCGVTSA